MNRTSLLAVATSITMLLGCDSASQARTGMAAGASLVGVGTGVATAGVLSPETPEVAVIGGVAVLLGTFVFMGSATSGMKQLDQQMRRTRAAGAIPRRRAPTGRAPVMPSASRGAPAASEPETELERWHARASTLEASLPAEPAREVRSALRDCLYGSAVQCRLVGEAFQAGELGTTPSITTACAAYAAGCELNDEPSCELHWLECPRESGLTAGAAGTAFAYTGDAAQEDGTLSTETAAALEAAMPSLLTRAVSETVDRCTAGAASACHELGQVFELGLMGQTASLPSACAAYAAGCELRDAASCTAGLQSCVD